MEFHLQYREAAHIAISRLEGIGSGDMVFPGIERALNILVGQCSTDEERIAVMKAVVEDPEDTGVRSILHFCASAMSLEAEAVRWADIYVRNHGLSDVAPHVQDSRNATERFLNETEV